MADGFKIEIDQNAINEYIAKMVAESYLGKSLREDLTRAVSSAMHGSYGNGGVLQQVANEVVRGLAMAELRSREDELKVMIRETFTDEWLRERVKDVTDGLHVVTSKID